MCTGPDGKRDPFVARSLKVYCNFALTLDMYPHPQHLPVSLNSPLHTSVDQYGLLSFSRSYNTGCCLVVDSHIRSEQLDNPLLRWTLYIRLWGGLGLHRIFITCESYSPSTIHDEKKEKLTVMRATRQERQTPFPT